MLTNKDQTIKPWTHAGDIHKEDRIEVHMVQVDSPSEVQRQQARAKEKKEVLGKMKRGT